VLDMEMKHYGQRYKYENQHTRQLTKTNYVFKPIFNDPKL